MGILKDYTKGSMDKLRSLKYSEYGGKEPYIQKSEGFQYNQINSRITDVERFAKLLTSKPGLKFQGNQALLQQVDQLKKLREASKPVNGKFNFKGLLKSVAKQAIKTVTNNVASTASIIAQVPVNGTGTHFIKGLAPSGYLLSGAGPQTGLGSFLRDVGIGGGVNGAKSALAGNTVGNPENGGGLRADGILKDTESTQTLLSRQQSLGATKLSRVAEDMSNFKVEGIPSLNLPKVNPVSLAASKLPSIGKKLLGINKPSSLPFLNTSDTEYTEYLGKEVIDKDVTSLPKLVSTQVAKDRKILEKKFNSDGTTTTSVSTDSIKENTEDLINYKPVGSSYTYTKAPVNIQNKYRLGDQGNPNSTYGGTDQVNVLAEQTANILESDIQDIIPFQFEVVEPNMETPRFLYFRAFLDTLNDSYTGDWSGTKYIGRAEQFYTYQGFNRALTFSFKIAAFSKSELIPLYKKLNYLVGTTAPTYASNGEFMKGTFTAVTIGDYITNQEGIITSVSLDWNKSYQWETNTQSGRKVPMLPHVLDVSVNFTPIHDFNVKSNINNAEELYIGGETKLDFTETVEPLETGIETRGVTPLPTTLPTATPFTG